METNEGRPSGQTLKEKRPERGGLLSRRKDTWLGRNWSTVLILVAIILVALFVRSYFGYTTAVDNGFLVAGGSDSYYHQRVIDHVQETGNHLVQDPLLNYPLGMRNARPPLYDWSVAIGGQLLSGITGMDIDSATGYALLSSTAIWGALTCIPVFLLTREAFGNRAGILAALLLAIMPGNIQRSIFAVADHDAMILFFVVFALYFLLRSLKTMSGTKWVSNWRERGAVRSGIRSYLSTNQRSLIYALLGGVCVAAVAMTWTGYTYLLVIILVYFLVQVVINRFRNVDSMGEFFIVGTMLASAFAIIAPLYWQMSYWTQWFDVPFYLFLGSMVLGAMFMVSRDYPWTLVIPAVLIVLGVGLAAVYFIAPNIFEAIVSGQGYLVKSKLYSTIQEAQAPGFSDLALSFGPVTFWLAIIGLAWAAIKIPKNPAPHFTFVVVWMGVSMYMAASAARFMFNASPAFAMAAGWILATLIAWIRLEELPRGLSGFRSNPWGTIKKGVKLRHVAGALFVAFLIIVPNVWGAVDASIPSETKRSFDKQIYFAMPQFLRPANYDQINGSFWYLGAFSYSLPLPSGYWPAAWSWYAQQDTDLDVADRPAFLSWWDYGFEAIQQGQHPAVSDNFQNAYQYAGSFITEQNETGAVALFIVRILESTGFTSEVNQVLTDAGVDAAKLQDIMSNPSNYIDEVKNNPDIYGPYDSELSAPNAKYAAARVELSKVGLENLVTVYNQMRAISGEEIGYFAVDSRLFPFSATYNSIFYAPATLSDRVIDPNTNAPSDYYDIMAVTATGETKRIQDLTSSDFVVNYVIVYKQAFYNTMLYRTMMGYGPSDVGKSSQGIPGISGSLASMEPMPGWNLTHFKQVYRTAYYSELNSTEAAKHPDSWRAISYEEALQRQENIKAGKDNGTVDLSPSTLTNGVVFIQYFDGAILEGRAVSNDGTPYAGIHVTAVDEYGIPHDSVRTDDDGRYRLILPFGNISVVYSAGTKNPQTQVATVMESKPYNISYDQAMRRDPNYTFNGDITLPGSIVSGTVFWDLNGDGRYSSGDEYIEGATVVLENPTNGFRQEVVTDANGAYKIIGLAGDNNNLHAVYQGHSFGQTSVSMSPFGTLNRNIAIEPAEISGTVEFSTGDPAGNVDIRLTDKTTGESKTTTTSASGAFTFDRLLPGEYSLSTADGNLSVGAQDYNLSAGDVVNPTLRLSSATQVTGSVSIDGQPQGDVAVGFLSEEREVWVRTNDDGSYTATMPQGNYTAYALTLKDGTDYVAMVPFAADDEAKSLDLNLVEAAVVSGAVKNGETPVSGATVIFTNLNGGAHIKTTTNATGQYKLFLQPHSQYFVYAAGADKAYWNSFGVGGSGIADLALADSAALSGAVYRDTNGNNATDSGEGIANALLRVQDPADPAKGVYFVADGTGKFNIALPKGASYQLTVTADGYGGAQRTYEAFDGKSENIALTAHDRTVTGTVSADGAALEDGYTIEFVGTGGGAVSNSAPITGGSFSVDLAPGSYNVIIDREGQVASKYTYNGTLVVPVGRDIEPLDLEAVLKVLVNLTTDVQGTGTIRLVGPEDRTVEADTLSMYLTPGNYTVYTDITSGGSRRANLTAVTIEEGSEIDIVTAPAHALNGEVQFEGATLSGTSRVTVTAGEASLPVNTGSSGTFTVYLPSGTYEVSAERAAKQAVDGVQRYVLYTGSETVTLSGPTSVDIATERGYDNVTLSGNITGGSPSSLQFTAISETAMDTTASVSGGSYTVDLAPGTYAVYGVDGSNVVLRTIEVKPSQDNEHNWTMVQGYTVSGEVRNDDGPMDDVEITFADVVPHTIVASGSYSVVLPAGNYNVSATGTVDENGVLVTWARSFNLDLNGSATRDIDLQRQFRGVVELEWDDSDKQTVDAGESVTYDIVIRNRGNVDDTYRLSSTSSWDVEFSQSEVFLPWGANSTATVQVTIRTPADAKVTHPLINIRAVSLNNSGASDTEGLDVGINPLYAVAISPAAAQTNGTTYTIPVVVRNTGNADDTYDLTISNEARDALRAQGWRIEIPGSSSLSKTVAVQAGKSTTIDLVLTKDVENPDPNASVAVAVESDNGATAYGDLPVVRLDLSSPGPSVSGGGASMDAPQVPGVTWVLIALIALLAVALVILRVNKGVFGRRRKR